MNTVLTVKLRLKRIWKERDSIFTLRRGMEASFCPHISKDIESIESSPPPPHDNLWGRAAVWRSTFANQVPWKHLKALSILPDHPFHPHLGVIHLSRPSQAPLPPDELWNGHYVCAGMWGRMGFYVSHQPLSAQQWSLPVYGFIPCPSLYIQICQNLITEAFWYKVWQQLLQKQHLISNKFSGCESEYVCCVYRWVTNKNKLNYQ